MIDRGPSRRDLLAGAALGAGIAAVSRPRGATAQQSAVIDGVRSGFLPTIRRYMVGSFEITLFFDGQRDFGAPHPLFGANVPEDEVATLATQNFLEPDRLVIGFTMTLVNTGSSLVMIDAGNGAGGRPDAGRLAALLAEAGISPDDIDVVALSHFHPDHVGGLIEDGAPLFPNARYVASAPEYDFWTGDLTGTRFEGLRGLIDSNVVPFAERMTFLSNEESVVSGVSALAAFGHTPGHMAYHLESEGRRLVVTGDAANHPVFALQRPDLHFGFDAEPDMAVAARKNLFGMIAADRIPFVGYHMPFPALGYVEPLGEGFRYVPHSYQVL